MTTRTNHGIWTLTRTPNYIDVTSSHRAIDTHWRYTDEAGHQHHYDHGYPTLDHVIDASHWCDGSEGFEPHDPHEHIDESHYECAQCGEVIEPGWLPPFTPQRILGSVEVTLAGDVRSEGQTDRVEIWFHSDEQTRSFVEAWNTAEDPSAVAHQFWLDHPDQADVTTTIGAW